MTKYTWWNFLFLCLLEQITRVANFYFLVVGVLFTIDSLTPLPPGYSRYAVLAALGFVITVSMFREAIEEYRQYRSDKEVNGYTTHALRDGKFEALRWDQVVTGDIVMVNRDESFCADLVMMTSSGPDGTCYIETANLDGETNLKLKHSVRETYPFDKPDLIQSLRGVIECEPPNARLYNFNARINIGNDEIPVNVDNLLLRGANLRNTTWIYGLVVYTGRDTRLMRNQQRKKPKASRVESKISTELIIIFGILLVMAAFSAVANSIWKGSVGAGSWYLEIDKDSSSTTALRFITFLLNYSQLVPISLYVSLEIVKVMQAAFISWDVQMRDPETGIYARARTSNINEELGQVEYIFSDKTGTLTCNVMRFFKCSVGGVEYGSDDDIPNTKALAASSATAAPTDEGVGSPDTKEFAFRDARFLLDLHSQATNAAKIREFLTMMAICHTVVPEVLPSGVLKYQASSPDEEALVKAAGRFGFVFQTRGPAELGMVVSSEGTFKYEILNVLEFNSDRKRMSLICRNPKGEIVLYCKGADSKIFARCVSGETLIDITRDHLEKFSVIGLRTLCFGKRIIDPTEYEQWNEKFKAASLELVDRDHKVDEVCELIEKDLELIGASAIEDRLQDGVQETLRALAAAKIKLWMLTGDKQETAINIGFSCGLLEHDMRLIVLSCDSEEEALHDLEKAIGTLPPSNKDAANKDRLALVIEGHTLAFLLKEAHKRRLHFLARQCSTCICCRVTPLQKALVVKLVRDLEDVVTLSVGDGANDVSMIQTAHVGVGIQGKEGVQAVQASDFSIGQFRFLRRLLFVHGRWSYKRTTKLILYSIYKNSALTWTYFWFSFFSGFSGTTFYDGWVSGLFNVIFCSVPVLVMATQDQDAPDAVCMAFPQLYTPGQLNTGFNQRMFWGWFFTGLIHSLPIFFLTYNMMDMALADGKRVDFWSMNTCVFSVLVVVVTLKLALHLSTWNHLSHIFTWGSIFVYFGFIAIYSSAPFVDFAPNMSNVGITLCRSPYFWLAILVVPIVTLMPDFTWRVVRKNYTRSVKVELLKAVVRMEKKKRAGAVWPDETLDKNITNPIAWV
eukprot:CAMPEP_0184644446 /NCGR_PEP_ID=MMETSP0308-20130426/1165_1 /TAXON_ID=38269 /ORGANISM="Gloeochaete witrockiana, Strain SAG 46.84" /LENGTH=1076 /DNA_ID=CAMNT_0027072989 /DNA_START=331 /DNA_END=3561 /DNA_ORIENTATION=-